LKPDQRDTYAISRIVSRNLGLGISHAPSRSSLGATRVGRPEGYSGLAGEGGADRSPYDRRVFVISDLREERPARVDDRDALGRDVDHLADDDGTPGDR
jgi:hypothetical protein